MVGLLRIVGLARAGEIIFARRDRQRATRRAQRAGQPRRTTRAPARRDAGAGQLMPVPDSGSYPVA